MGPRTRRAAWLAGLALASACSHANDAAWEDGTETSHAAGEARRGEDVDAGPIELVTTSGEAEALSETCSPQYVTTNCSGQASSVPGWPKTLVENLTYTTTGWKGVIGNVGPGLANTWVVVKLQRTNLYGDPDLYVKKNGQVSNSNYDCYNDTADNPEFCAFYLENDSDYLSVGIGIYSVSTGSTTVTVTADAGRCNAGTVYTGALSFEGKGLEQPPAMQCCACLEGVEAVGRQCCWQITECTQPSDCERGFCVDGYCCNTPCAGACGRCDFPDSLGICKAAPAGSPGSPSCGTYLCDGEQASCPTSCIFDIECIDGHICKAGACVPKAANGAACTSFRDCQSNHCVDGICCDTACTGDCGSCTQPGTVGTCTPFADGTVGLSCGLYRCDGVSTDCPDGCEDEGDCVDGSYCAFGSCQPKAANGAACSGDEQCQSGHCVDNTCCNTACDGQCERCDAPGSLGECTAVIGKPVGNRPACDDDGTGCGGTCDGVTRASCAYPGAAVGCGSASCVDGVATEAGHCDGQGSCVSPTQLCAPYACGDQGCLESCETDADCKSPAVCVRGECIGTLELGASCAADGDCRSGHCVDGVCCNTACDGECQACNLAGSVGTCRNETGGECGGTGGLDPTDPFAGAGEEDEGCGCRVVGAKAGERRAYLGLLLGLAVLGRRLRRAA